MFSMNRMEGPWPQQTRQFSTGNKPLFNTMPSSAGFLNKFNVNMENIATQKRFANPNFVNPHNRNTHSCPSKLNLPPRCQHLIEVCSEFTVKTNSSSVPTGRSRHHFAPNVPFNTDETEMKENTQRQKDHKLTLHVKKSRRSSPRKEHKNKTNIDLKYEIDEVGIDVLSDSFESDSNDLTPTAEIKIPPVFIHEAMPEPICIAIAINAQNINRRRIPSDCCSEDSFIVFQCDTGDEEDDDDSSDYETETDSEEEDSESSCSDDEDIHVKTDEENSKDTSRIMKKVTFADDLIQIHPMIKWSYAYQAARKGPWEECARDRGRFKDRISKFSGILSPILQPAHREKVYRQIYQ